MQSLWFETLLLEGAWEASVRLSHSEGRIAAITRGTAPEAGDERHAIGLPGLSNLHSHGFQRGMAGLAERRGPAGDDFWTWRETMYRFLDRMDPDDVEAVTALAYTEMLEAGFTHVGEFHYLHHAQDGRPYDDLGELARSISAAAAVSGVGLTLLPVFYAHGDFGGADPHLGQRRFLNSLDQFAALYARTAEILSALPGARLGVAPHSLRAVTPEELAAVLPLAGDGPVHIHAAEQVREVTDCVAWSGQRPVAWLLDHAPVDRRWCLIHATHLTRAETLALARSGAVAGLCPITEANLGDGIFPAGAYVQAGGAFGIGSDSNVLIEAAGELRALEYAQRLSSRARNVLAVGEGGSVGGFLFRQALAGGAQALALAPGGLRVGDPLDLVSLDGRHPSLIGRTGDALLDGWIFAGTGALDCVWRRGAKLVEGGRHRAREEAQRRYARRLPRLIG